MKYPTNDKFKIIIKTVAQISSGFVNYFGVNEETFNVEGEAIKQYIDPNKEYLTKYCIGLFVSTMIMGNTRYYFAMNGGGEFEGEMLSLDSNDTGF